MCAGSIMYLTEKMMEKKILINYCFVYDTLLFMLRENSSSSFSSTKLFRPNGRSPCL